jgi:DNA polymerase-3 subunit alpha
VLPPDVNTSFKMFTVDQEQIRYGLLGIKNVGEGAIDIIIQSREADGPFTTLFEFCERVDLKRVNKRVLESLIKCGAFDTVAGTREQKMAALEAALDYGQRVQREKASPQLGLFDMDDGQSVSINPPALPDAPMWDERERLQLEKETLGLYITGHPLGRYEKILKVHANADAQTLKEKSDGEAVRIGGIITAIKRHRTRKNEEMAFITTEDSLGAVETVVFASVYAASSELIVEDTPILVEGRVQVDEFSAKVIADRLLHMDAAESACTAAIHIDLDAERTNRELLVQLRDLLMRHAGECPGFIHLRQPDRSETVIRMGRNLGIKPGEPVAREINTLLGYEAVRTASLAPKPAAQNGRFRNGRR